MTAAWRPLRGWIALAAVLLLVVGLFSVLRGGDGPSRTITAHFKNAPGLFEGNQVQVLGMKVGRVTKITPNPDGVDVRFEVPEDLDLPDDVKAMILAPNLISDRSLALDPAYTGGAKFGDRREIPMERTAAPLSADQVIESVDKLAKALGPEGANANGDLNNLLASLANAFGPDGKPLNDTISNFGQALGALGSQQGDLTTLFNSLGALTTTASQNLQSYTSFSQNLAAVSATLAGEKADIGTALATLSEALADLSTFVTDNSATLGGSVAGLNTFAASLARQQESLQETFRTGATTLENLHAAVTTDPDTKQSSLTTRYSGSASAEGFGTSVCGNSVLRLLTLALRKEVGSVYDGKTGDDLVCGLNGVVSQLPPVPGAPGTSLAPLVAGTP